MKQVRNLHTEENGMCHKCECISDCAKDLADNKVLLHDAKHKNCITTNEEDRWVFEEGEDPNPQPDEFEKYTDGFDEVIEYD